MSTSFVSVPFANPKEGQRLRKTTQATPRPAITSSRILSQAVQDLYRCPDGFLKFEVARELATDAGYFRLGDDVIGYGRSVSASRRRNPSGQLDDLDADAVVCEGTVRLPFNPSEIIDNLRLERYAKAGGRLQRALRKLYYGIRPLTTRSMRKRVQQFHAHGWQERSFPRWPVDTTVESLSEKLMLLALQGQGVERIPFVWFWPQGARGCVTMTHDVEAEAGRDFCGALMDIDDAFGVKASFQIIPEDRYSVSEKFLASIRERGFEIGVQDLNHDGRLFDSREEFLRRTQRINRYGREYGAGGFRAGVLYRKPEWYDALEFSFEMSMPNVAHLDPQRGGCCTVMPYFIGDILEIPVTTVQDYTLFHLLHEHSMDLWKTQLNLILAKNGMASFIVHPDYVIDPETRRVYQELLGYLRDFRERENLWLALPSEIDRWWRARSRMSVVADGNSVRIEGEGSERAVLAFATNVDGKLVYEVESSGAQP